MQSRLTGKKAIITGGGGGIGSETALLFCEQGASVLLVDRDHQALALTRQKIERKVQGAQVFEFVADLGHEETAGRIVEQALTLCGGIDILMNNAGMRAYEPIAESQADTWHNVLAVNLLSYAYLIREALPELRKSGAGSIINISSTHAFNPRPGMGQYDVTKAGIVSLTKTVAAEEARQGVRVNAVCPGFTLTPFHIKRSEEAGRSANELETEERKECLLRRWAHPREVAYPILWLASDEASYITGTALVVDGGMPVFRS